MPVYFLEHHKPRVISRNADVFRKYDSGSLLAMSKNV